MFDDSTVMHFGDGMLAISLRQYDSMPALFIEKLDRPSVTGTDLSNDQLQSDLIFVFKSFDHARSVARAIVAPYCNAFTEQ